MDIKTAENTNGIADEHWESAGSDITRLSDEDWLSVERAYDGVDDKKELLRRLIGTVWHEKMHPAIASTIVGIGLSP